MGLLDRLTTMGVDSVTGLGDHLKDTEQLGQIGLSPEDYNVISAMNAADNMNAGLGSLVAPGALYSIGDTIANPNQGFMEGVQDFGRYMKGVNIQSNPELAKQLMGQDYVNKMQGKYALAMDEIGKGIFGKGPNPDLYNQQKATNIGTAPGIFDINQVGDPALNPGSVNAMGIDPFGVNEDLIDRGNPTGDPRVVSEEMGMVGRPTTSRPTMADIAGPINENLRDLGNPLGDSRIASEEQGLSGFPGLGQVDPGFQNVLDAREARRNEIAMQQNPDYGQFFDAPAVNDPQQGINYDALGILGTLGGLITGSLPAKALGMYGNFKSGRTGRALDGISRGLGSLGRGMSSVNRAMRGYNPVTGRTNTQAQYEAAREARRTQNRIDNMLERKAKGLSYSQKNLDRLSAEVNKGINEREAAALADKTKSTSTGVRTDIDVADGGAEAGGGGKIVCTMMNERYGFGSFRNKIWMKFHEHHGPEYQKGYHAIFLPLVKIAKGKGKINTAVRKVLEHMGRHVTADMFKIMKGKKRDTLGRIYRAIFEPACHIIGKIKSALGRG